MKEDAGNRLPAWNRMQEAGKQGSRGSREAGSILGTIIIIIIIII